MKDKYPFLIRLFLVFPAMLFMGIFWAIIGLISTERIGRVLKKTGENLLKP